MDSLREKNPKRRGNRGRKLRTSMPNPSTTLNVTPDNPTSPPNVPTPDSVSPKNVPSPTVQTNPVRPPVPHSTGATPTRVPEPQSIPRGTRSDRAPMPRARIYRPPPRVNLRERAPTLRNAFD